MGVRLPDPRQPGAAAISMELVRSARIGSLLWLQCDRCKRDPLLARGRDRQEGFEVIGDGRVFGGLAAVYDPGADLHVPCVGS